MYKNTKNTKSRTIALIKKVVCSDLKMSTIIIYSFFILIIVSKKKNVLFVVLVVRIVL